jgi:cobalt-zinc-cadmium efflux system protein
MGHDHNHNHSHAHGHHHHATGNIVVAFWLNTSFALLEVFGGLFTNSMAILSDALHDFGDSVSLGLAWYFQKLSAKKRDKFYSYGYRRFSLLGAFINSLVLIIGSVFILQEAIPRLFHPEQADAKGMIVFAIIGIAVNGYAVLKLRKGSSINEQVVSLHLLEDVLGWVAVLIGSIIMLFVNVPVLDPILSILITGYVLFNVYKNLRSSFKIILQGIPVNVNVDEIKNKVSNLPGISGLHDVHVWTMDGEYNVLTIHLVTKENLTLQQSGELKQKVKSLLPDLNVQHSTIEIETENENCELDKC